MCIGWLDGRQTLRWRWVDDRDRVALGECGRARAIASAPLVGA